MEPVTAAAVSNVELAPEAVARKTQPRSKKFETVKRPQSDHGFIDRVGRVVDDVRADEKKVDGAVARLSSGRDMDAVELLRIQSLVYGYSQRVDLASKVVESATSGLKQMLNTQV